MTEMISRPFSTEPTAEYRLLMSSIDVWLKSRDDEPTWDDTDELLGAMVRALRFADSTCDCDGNTLNYPHELEQERPGLWRAIYQCIACGRLYDVSWADRQNPGT